VQRRPPDRSRAWPGPAAADRPRVRRPARPPTGSVADDDDRRRRQTTTDNRRQRAKQDWPIRRASNNRLKQLEFLLASWRHMPRCWPLLT